MLNKLFEEFENIIVLDTETTGLDAKSEEIIQFSACCFEKNGGEPRLKCELDFFIKLEKRKTIPEFIKNLTHITDKMLEEEGLSKAKACEEIYKILAVEKPLIVAYNAQFDLNFIYYLLASENKASCLKGAKMLDALGIFRDRYPYPHKLDNAVEAYNVSVQNTHRAIDDVRATVEVLKAMEIEEDDLHKYVNIFGYNAKYGISGNKISSVKYVEQDYKMNCKLYEK